MRGLALLLLLIVVSLPSLAGQALHFPALSAHVVDEAHVLKPETTQELDERLFGFEKGTSNQVIVATVPDLQGAVIEDFANQLYRYWKLGDKSKNNGILLLLAMQEHKLRIEVGYGLEGEFTDAMSSQIINQIMVPSLKTGDNEKAVVDGANAIMETLGGKILPAHMDQQQEQNVPGFIVVLFWIFIIYMVLRHPDILLFMAMNGSFRSGGGSSRGSSWGGGGGGSSGGGGASGSW